VRAAFRRGLAAIRADLPLMPLSRLNESVFRYHVCRFIADKHPNVEQFVECNRIDLVLSSPAERAFVEFKFYVRPKRFDPYGGKSGAFKGRPSPQNLREFQQSVDKLSRVPDRAGLSKFVVLAYADPTAPGRGMARYADLYDAYQHPSHVGLRTVEASETIPCGEDALRATLYEIERRTQ
jgi:hypothetical protein